MSLNELLKESDWLASTPFFYDDGRDICGEMIWELIRKGSSWSFHPEGLFNYLDFGYSVLEQTPLEGLRFLPHSTRLWQTDTGLEIERLDDPFDRYDSFRVSESDVIELIRSRVQAWENSLPSDQEIVLPLSGGFDSRLLLWCVRDKSRVRAFTYGLSDDQRRSKEVVHALALAERFGIRWERIELGGFHRYFDDWDEHFGISTHAHGMYHFEFYSKIRERLHGRHAFLSGIFGDAWAGGIPPLEVENAADLVGLGYTHGLRADPQRIRVHVEHKIREQFFLSNRERLRDHRFQIVTTARLKLMLISYLLSVPKLFNFDAWSPYLDIEVAMSMLNLPQERRLDRKWQWDFFRREGLNLEDMSLVSSEQNNLNFQALKCIPLRPLNSEILVEVVDPSYVDWINCNARMTRLAEFNHTIQGVRIVGEALRLLGIGEPLTLEAYCAYLCIKPIENLLIRYHSRR
jgi:hypothetical protein